MGRVVLLVAIVLGVVLTILVWEHTPAGQRARLERQLRADMEADAGARCDAAWGAAPVEIRRQLGIDRHGRRRAPLPGERGSYPRPSRSSSARSRLETEAKYPRNSPEKLFVRDHPDLVPCRIGLSAGSDDAVELRQRGSTDGAVRRRTVSR